MVSHNFTVERLTSAFQVVFSDVMLTGLGGLVYICRFFAFRICKQPQTHYAARSRTVSRNPGIEQ